jgi:replicative DNA helicase Mcm
MIELDMSPGSEADQHADLWEELFSEYYEDDIHQLIQRYPDEQNWITVDYDHIQATGLDLADTVLERPEFAFDVAKVVLSSWEVPVPGEELDENVQIRVTNLPDHAIYQPEDIRAEHGGQYVGIKASLGKVTQPVDYPDELAFSCAGSECNSTVYIEQEGRDIQEPTQACPVCEKSNRWQPDLSVSEFVDLSRVKLQQSIDQTKGNEGTSITGVVSGSLVEGYGTELYARAGEDCVAYGVLKRREADSKSWDLLFKQYLDVQHINFDTDEDTVDPDAHRDRIEEIVTGHENPVETFVENIAPQLKVTDRWERAVWLATAYLFKAPRIHTDSGEIYRGDIHAGIIGDPGIGKSVLNRAIERISPKCERRSATGISSDVGLTAAAINDDFGEGEYTLEPGILVRANGGHAVIDEIDKGPSELQKINDALEGDQRVTVDKGGKHAEFATRTALWATGNPDGGRFEKGDHADPLPAQVDIDVSLRDRFDGLVLIPDEQDDEHDSDVAGHILDAYEEASNDTVKNDVLERDVSLEELQAWVLLGQEIDPALTESAKDTIQTYYTELRARNDDSDTFAITARGVESLIRFAGAFARLHLSDTITDKHATLATELMNKIIGQNYDPETGEWKDVHEWDSQTSQKSRKEQIKSAIRMDTLSIEEIHAETDIQERKIEAEIERLKKTGDVIEPQTGEYRLV